MPVTKIHSFLIITIQIAFITNIDCPTLVIGDKDDKVFYYTTSENIKDYIGFNARLYLFEEYGHAVYDMSDKFKEVVFDFFEE